MAGSGILAAFCSVFDLLRRSYRFGMPCGVAANVVRKRGSWMLPVKEGGVGTTWDGVAELEAALRGFLQGGEPARYKTGLMVPVVAFLPFRFSHGLPLFTGRISRWSAGYALQQNPGSSFGGFPAISQVP